MRQLRSTPTQTTPSNRGATGTSTNTSQSMDLQIRKARGIPRPIRRSHRIASTTNDETLQSNDDEGNGKKNQKKPPTLLKKHVAQSPDLNDSSSSESSSSDSASTDSLLSDSLLSDSLSDDSSSDDEGTTYPPALNVVIADKGPVAIVCGMVAMVQPDTNKGTSFALNGGAKTPQQRHTILEQPVRRGAAPTTNPAVDGTLAVESTTFILPKVDKQGCPMPVNLKPIHFVGAPTTMRCVIQLPTSGKPMGWADLREALRPVFEKSLSAIKIRMDKKNHDCVGFWLVNFSKHDQPVISSYHSITEALPHEDIVKFLLTSRSQKLPSVGFAITQRSSSIPASATVNIDYVDDPVYESTQFGPSPVLRIVASEEKKSVQLEALTRKLAAVESLQIKTEKELVAVRRQLPGIRATFGGKTLNAAQLQERGLRQVRTEKYLEQTKANLERSTATLRTLQDQFVELQKQSERDKNSLIMTLDKLNWQNSILKDGIRRDDLTSVARASEKIQPATEARKAAGIRFEEDEGDSLEQGQDPQSAPSSNAVAVGAHQDHPIQFDDEAEQEDDDCEYEVDEEVVTAPDGEQAGILLDNYEVENAVAGSSKRTYEEANLEEDDTGFRR